MSVVGKHAPRSFGRGFRVLAQEWIAGAAGNSVRLSEDPPPAAGPLLPAQQGHEGSGSPRFSAALLSVVLFLNCCWFVSGVAVLSGVRRGLVLLTSVSLGGSW